MNICFLTSLYMPFMEGAEIFLDRLVRDLQYRGHQVVVIAARRRGEKEKLDYPFVRGFRHRSKRYFLAANLPILLWAHRKHHFNIIHCHGEYQPAITAYYFNKITKVPYVCRATGGAFSSVHAYPKLQRKLAKGLSRASLLIAQGDFLKQRILEKNVNKEKIIVINNGVRISEITACKNISPCIEPPYILHVGGLRKVKAYDIAILSFEKIAQKFSQLKLVIAGCDQEKKHFDQLIKEKKLIDRIIYLGNKNRKEIASLFCHAELYLSPFRKAPFSNANLEAMASGIPIVATAIEGNLEQIRDGIEGFLVPIDDVDLISEKMCLLIENRDLRKKMGENARQRSQFYSWEKMVDKYENCYRRIVSAF